MADLLHGDGVEGDSMIPSSAITTTNTDTNKDIVSNNTSESLDAKRPPFPKKKLALLFGYSGSGYSGLQVNPGCLTIESVILDALPKAGLVWARNANQPKKIDWQRACRTDKGVHAVGNVISFKGLLVTDFVDGQCGVIKGEEQKEWSSEYAVKMLNNHLPAEIRVFDIVRATNSFDAHVQCDSRFYEYTFPTFLLESEEYEFVEKPNTQSLGNDEATEETESLRYEMTSEDMERVRSFRLTAEKVDLLKQGLQCYTGTLNFHNFTIGKAPKDPSSMRFIRSFTVSKEPFVDSKTQIEWVSLRVHGASFMLHQIRKMVGLVILGIKYNLALSGERLSKLVKDALQPENKWNIPKAPGQGLFLDKACFSGYNKYLKEHSNVDDNAQLSKDFIDFDKYEQQREKLKEDLIYPAIFENTLPVFYGWQRALRAHSYEFKYLLQYMK